MQVKSKDITSVTANNPIQALQGRVTGVSVVTNSRPGESPTLRIRGNGSISAGNDPLYVVDGFPLMNGSLNEINANVIHPLIAVYKYFLFPLSFIQNLIVQTAIVIATIT